MNLWSRWKQRDENRYLSEQIKGLWFSRSFNLQMSEIDSEMARVLRDDKKLKKIRSDREYVGEPQVIQRIFELVKMDPKNIALHREIELAEKETFSFLSGAPDAPTAEEMGNYWSKYFQAYLAELEQKERQD